MDKSPIEKIIYSISEQDKYDKDVCSIVDELNDLSNEEHEHFNKLFALDCTDKVEEKNGSSYLSWAYAWAEAKKMYPGVSYTVKRNENSMPYFYDENTGYMVFTEITIEDVTHEMWLPVMDGANKAMKSEPYSYKTKYGEKEVQAATMFDINKAIMRCLVKNLAMFGLGLYIYAGEDLPEDVKKQQQEDYRSNLLGLTKDCKTIAEVNSLYKKHNPSDSVVLQAMRDRKQELKQNGDN